MLSNLRTQREIILSAKTIKNDLIITVSDNGVGIPTAIINKLFSINKNITSSGTQNEKGTGLGLIICKEFIEKHNGKISVESEIKKGTTFMLTIPIKPANFKIVNDKNSD